jgi:hypothetical protein
VIDDENTRTMDRAHAAYVIQLLVVVVPVDEKLATDVANVIGRHLEDPDVVFALLRVLQRGCRDHLAKLTRALQRLCARAYAKQMAESLRVLVAVAIETPPWRKTLRVAWVHQVIMERLVAGREHVAALMLAEWLPERDRAPDWVRPLVEQHPALLADEDLSPPVRWQLHAAAPTVAGWKLLASIDQEHVLAPEAFGMNFRAAVETLGKAIDETPDNAMRVVLAIWRARLGNGE